MDSDGDRLGVMDGREESVWSDRVLLAVLYPLVIDQDAFIRFASSVFMPPYCLRQR
jgi:phosphomannomutase